MKYSIRTTLHDRPRKDGTHIIRFRVSWNGNRLTHYLDTPILPSEWDPMSSTPTNHRALRELTRLRSDVNDLFDLCAIERRIPSMDDVRAVCDHRDTAPGHLPTHNILKAVDAFILEAAVTNDWSDRTVQRFRSLRKHLEEWDPRATTEAMDEAHMKSFLSHLYSADRKNSTVSKIMAQLRWFLRWCQAQGWTTTDTWNTYRPKFKHPSDNPIIYLSQDELHRLADLDLAADRCLSQVRDVFLFCCYTGLRYSDVAKLEWADIHDDGFSVVTQKTADHLYINWNSYSKNIIDRYRPDPQLGRPMGRCLPVISNQKMNDYLKDLAKLAGIDAPIRQVYYVRGTRHEEVHPKHELITTHCGRRTFVVMALSLGIAPQVVMKITGHSDYKAMLPYIDITSNAQRTAMSLFDTL